MGAELMEAKERTIYRLTYFRDQPRWDNGDCDYKEFNDVHKAMVWGKANDNDFGFHIDKVEQTFQEPPLGKQWRKEEYGWDNGEEEKTLVYDGNSNYELTEQDND